MFSLSFKEIKELEQKIGVKNFNKKLADAFKNYETCYKSEPNSKNCERNSKTKKWQKSSPNLAPIEISSKSKPLSGLTSKRCVPTPQPRDPRFDELSGKFDQELFAKGYAFLEEVRGEDAQNLKRFVKLEKDEERVKTAENMLANLESNGKLTKTQKKVSVKLREIKKIEVDKVAEGKKRYYLKNSEKKKIELAEKFKTLKRSGKLDAYLAKKRKKKASKSKKFVPCGDK